MSNSNLDNLILKGQMALEDGEFSEALQIFDSVLNQDVSVGAAWWGKFLARHNCRTGQELASLRLSHLAPATSTPTQAQLVARIPTESYVVPGYLELPQIQTQLQQFPAIYLATAPCRQAQLDEERLYWETGTAARIVEICGAQSPAAIAKSQILHALEDRLTEANRVDRAALAQVEDGFVRLQDQLVQQKHDATARRTQDHATAKALAGSQNPTKLKAAIALLTTLGDYADCPALLTATQKKLSGLVAKWKRRGKQAGCWLVGILAAVLIFFQFILPPIQYSQAEDLLLEGKTAQAAIAFNQLGSYSDAQKRSFELWGQIAQRKLIAASEHHVVAIKEDGTVVAAGDNHFDECRVEEWTDIVALDVSFYHTVGLKADGTLVALGYNSDGRCEVDDFSNVVAISVGDNHTLVLCADGTVVGAGENDEGQCDLKDWEQIIAVSAGEYHSVGLRADGTVVAKGSQYRGKCNVQKWTDIVAISAGEDHTVGLRKDGTVVATGANNEGQCNVAGWTDIVAISADRDRTIGLRADGTVVVVGESYHWWYKNAYEKEEDWRHVVSIDSDYGRTAAILSNGTAIANEDYDQRSGFPAFEDWKDLKTPKQ